MTPSVNGQPAGQTPPRTVAKDHARQMRLGMELFRAQVGPLLRKHCFSCHGGKKSEGGLSLINRSRLLKGGSSGPAIKTGAAKGSLLIQVVRHIKEPHMPLDAEKLSKRSIEYLEKWIGYGAPYDKPLGQVSKSLRTSGKVTATDRRFWSFSRIRPPQIPDGISTERTHNPMDRFIISKLASVALRPAPPAESRWILARRAYLTVVGFPPTPAQLREYTHDSSPDAYDRMIDRLLSNPAYGEQWGRYWLDVARFAESYGFEHDLDNPHAFHYRDFVIRAFNQDLPYRDFVAWQIAGDELRPNLPLARLATGFLAAGVHNADIAKIRVELERYDELDDIANTVGVAMLGLSIGCARCHDHKYDPIPQADYYRFIACFARTIRGEVKMATRLGGPPTKVLVAGEGLTPLKRMYNPGPAFFDPVYHLKRGDTRQKAGVARPGLLRVLAHRPAVPVTRTSDTKQPTYRRSAVARWLVDVEGGAGNLLARVIVNRLWQHHFGVGIVATPNDFGARGARPSHPQLLEWLAGELIRHQWQLKPIQRMILTSSTFRQSSAFRRRASRIDPGNQLLWRFRPRRLQAEAIRDALLRAAGQLDRRMYGPGTLDEGSSRRSVYFTVKRSQLIPMMTLFDQPAALQSIGRRATTTVAPQALALMNGPYVVQLADAFARDVLAEAKQDSLKAIDLAFRRALSRSPTSRELRQSREFIAQQTQRYRQRVHLAGELIRDTSLIMHLDSSRPGDKPRVWKNLTNSGLRAQLVQGGPPTLATRTPKGLPTLRFDGKSFYGVKNHRKIQFGTGDFSFSMLLRIAPGANGANIWGKDSYAGKSGHTGYFLQYHNQQFRFATRAWNGKSGPVNYLDARTRISAGRWVRISGVRLKNSLRLYLEDAAHADATLQERLPTNVDFSTDLKIGEMDDHLSGGFRGDIAEFCLYDRALTHSEVQMNHRYLLQRHLREVPRLGRRQAFSDFCHALFCLNEFIYPR